jgi:glutamine synthetase
VLEKILQERDADVVHIGQFDYASVFRERRLRKDQFLQWSQDPRFGNVIALWDSADSIFGGTSYFTEKQVIDPDSIRNYPAEPNAALIIAEMAGDLSEVMPRMVLRRQLERAESMGYTVDAAFEFELILLNETDTSVREAGFETLAKFAPDNKCWSGTTAATHAELIRDLEEEILGYDISLFGLGVELGPGCLEATLGATRGLRAADDAAFLRMATQSWARRNGLTASFMPYLGRDYPGIGGHVTLSLKDAASGENLFSSRDNQTNDLARRFIAGMIEVVPECFAMCTSSVNAYRRLAPGSWAPKALTWAEYTFTTAVRSVPATNDMARLEFRSPPADCNPYLTMALMLGAGLDGIERGLNAPAPAKAAGPDDIPEGAIRFPRDLFDAAERLAASDTARRLFGAAFIENFSNACLAEDASLRTAVSAQERQRYLER